MVSWSSSDGRLSTEGIPVQTAAYLATFLAANVSSEGEHSPQGSKYTGSYGGPNAKHKYVGGHWMSPTKKAVLSCIPRQSWRRYVPKSL